ncbi:MAG: hypothetical protein ACRDFR_01035 [Candidatus Limnocylindria bacterium]
MTLGDLVARMTDSLDKAGIPFMVTGSLASSFHGEPRTTRDVDLVIDPTDRALRSFLDSLPAEEFYRDADAARAALAERGQFNVVEIATGWKVDLVMRKDRPFSQEEFGRRLRVELFGRESFIATAEDTIIAKLEWAQAGESERQLRDVASIVAVSGDGLDRAYLDRWIRALGLEALWDRARSSVHMGGQ